MAVRSHGFDARRRELTRLHPALASRYLALVAAVAPVVEAGVPPVAAANRVAASSTVPPSLRLAPWRAERAAFARCLSRLASEAPCILFADVRDCYAAIAPPVVGAALRRVGCEADAARRIETFLSRLGDLGLQGLPVGPEASAVLANAVLAGVDETLLRAGVRHLRWVDDIVVAASGPSEAEGVLDLLRGALRTLGLRLNEAKTRVVLDPASVATAPTVSVARAHVPVG